MKFPFSRRKDALGHHSLQVKPKKELEEYNLDRTPSLQKSDDSSETSDSGVWETFEKPLVAKLDWPASAENQASEPKPVEAPTREETTEDTPSREPLWKRRSRGSKPDFAAVEDFDHGLTVVSSKPVPPPARASQRSSSSISKSVSFDESTFSKPHTSTASTTSSSPTRRCSPNRKPPSVIPENPVADDHHLLAGIVARAASFESPDLLTALQRAGSTFSDMFQDLVPEDDLFSVDTPSYLGTAYTEDSEDDDDDDDDETRTTVSSRRRRDHYDDDDDDGCADDLDPSDMLGAALGSCTDDLKTFGEMLLSEAHQCASCEEVSVVEERPRKPRRKRRN